MIGKADHVVVPLCYIIDSRNDILSFRVHLLAIYHDSLKIAVGIRNYPDIMTDRLSPFRAATFMASIKSLPFTAMILK